jgi:hypothetical protein
MLSKDHWAAGVLQRHIASGERIEWAGRPGRGLKFRGRDFFAVPFGFVWLMMALNWEILAIRGGAPLPTQIFGMLFVLVGLHLLVGRFFTDALRRRGTAYGVTSNRLLIVSGGLGKRIRSLDLDRIGETVVDTVIDPRDDTGSITFGELGADGGASGRRGRLPFAFEWIARPQEVVALIRREKEQLAR